MDFTDDPAADFLAREQDQLAEIGDDTIIAATPATDELQTINSDELKVEEETISGDFGSEIAAPQPAVRSPAPEPTPRVEPEKIRRWREEQQKRLEEKDAEEQKKMAEWREAAKKELDDWYKQHEDSVDKTRAANREAEKELASLENKSSRSSVDWDQIARLCEFNPKVNRNTKDTARLRGLILQLKQNPPVKTS